MRLLIQMEFELILKRVNMWFRLCRVVCGDVGYGIIGAGSVS
jgi:hypothetical protein